MAHALLFSLPVTNTPEGTRMAGTEEKFGAKGGGGSGGSGGPGGGRGPGGGGGAPGGGGSSGGQGGGGGLSLIHISEPTRLGMISYAVFCLKKKKIRKQNFNIHII